MWFQTYRFFLGFPVDSAPLADLAVSDRLLAPLVFSAGDASIFPSKNKCNIQSIQANYSSIKKIKE